MTLSDKIINLRDKLNKSLDENRKYEYIYNLSVELDQLIAEYYRQTTR
ncbi:aspartyl-phosphate phosphatase Spo0E family protein [Sporosalibacterium faouarense]|nr:aspartyl-phosphate phosphatase Spo0E family protein [Sporosalibacterium faouarense]MTI49052.1 Spo0E family sporulation regulatory protein-aspartic acid phosphatase [Bacillota bacterium]